MKNMLPLFKTLLFSILLISITNVHGQYLAPAIPNNNITPSLFTSSSASSSSLIECNRQAIIDDYNENYLGSNFNTAEIAWTGDVATCAPGSISATVHDKILQRINYFRRLAQVSDDIQLNEIKNGKCQETALMLLANGALTHCSGPNNSPCDTFLCNTTNAIEGALSSNIANNNWDYANPIDMYIQDSGSSNVDVGHRRWILFSRGNEMGNGITPNKHALWAIGDFAATPTYNNFIAYPSPGFFPRSLLYSRWSFGIPDANFSNATVSVTRDGQAMTTYIISNNTNYADPTLVWVVGSPPFTTDADVEYEVTISGITGALENSYTYTVIAIKEEMPSFSYEKTDPFCNDNGEVTVDFNVGAESYFWTPGGDTTQTITNLAAGTYLLTVTDLNECEYVDSVTVVNDTITTPQPGDGTPVSFQSISNMGSLNVSTTGTDLKTDEATGWWITTTNPVHSGISNQTELDSTIAQADIQPYNNGIAIDNSPSVLFLNDSILDGITYDCANMDPSVIYYATPFITAYRTTIPDTSCVAENGAVGNLFIGGQAGKYTSISPVDIDCRPASLLSLPIYTLEITISDYTGPVGELGIWIQDNSFNGNTLLYYPFLAGNGTYTYTQNDLMNYVPNDPGDPSWSTGLTVLSWHMNGNGMQNGNLEVSLDITYPGDPGIPFPSMTYSSCIFGTPVSFGCSDCQTPLNIPTAVGTYHATNECTDASGWTHYWDNVDGVNGNSDDLFLLSVQKDANDIGTIDDGTFDLFITVGNNNTGDAVHIPSTVPYVTNPEGWYLMDRYWFVSPTTQPSTPVAVRFYYTTEDFNDIDNAPDIDPLGHESLAFYKTLNPANPDPGLGHNGITSSQINFYNTEGVDWLYTGDAFNNYHTAELFTVNEFSGGGGGASDCEGCGPLPVELISFTGNLEEDQVLLKWKTASEENNDHFKLERSTDGIRFELLSNIPGMGNSSQMQQYKYIDKNPAKGINYYRLSQVDFDGSSHHSGNMVSVNYSKEELISYFPNPVLDKLYIRMESSSNRKIVYELYDVLGRLVDHGQFDRSDIREGFELDMSRYNEGMYLVQITDGTKNYTFSFLKE